MHCNARFNIYRKGFKAKIYDVEERVLRRNGEKYGKYVLAQGKSRIEALAYGDMYDRVKNVLKVINIKHFVTEKLKRKK